MFAFETARPDNTAVVTIFDPKSTRTTTLHTATHPAMIGKTIADTAQRWGANIFRLDITLAFPDGVFFAGNVKEIGAQMNARFSPEEK